MYVFFECFFRTVTVRALPRANTVRSLTFPHRRKGDRALSPAPLIGCSGISLPPVLPSNWNYISLLFILEDEFQAETVSNMTNLLWQAHSGKALPHDLKCFAHSSVTCSHSLDLFCCCFLCLVQNGSSNGELLIKNAQLKHAGLYTCMAQTTIDNVTASAQLVVRGESWVVQSQYTCS